MSRRRAAGIVAVTVALLAAPLVLNEFRTALLTEVLVFGLAAASLDLLVGYTGMVSLGHAAYFGVGGYAAALLATRVTANAPLAVLAGAAAAAAAAAVTGALAVRTRGVALLMLTLAFAQLGFSLATTWTAVTGGANGLRGVPRPVVFPGGAGVLASTDAFYLYALVVVAGGLALLRLVVTSPFGRSLDGIRSNEGRMRALGYSVRGHKVAAFTVAGAVAGGAGALFVQHARFISPTNVSFEISALLLIMVIVGGVRSLVGPVFGAAVVLLLRDELSTRVEQWELVLGVVFAAVVYLVPSGVAGLLRRAQRRRAGTGVAL